MINFLIVFLYLVQYINCGILTPPYFNLVTNKNVTATATCGEGVSVPELYCKLTASDREFSAQFQNNATLIQGQFCDYCNPFDPLKSHHASYAIDGTERWWQSPPLSRSLEYNQVNFTIDFDQEFHVAYIYIKMGNSPRPGVWVLEKSTDNGNTYQPWQYFADTPSDCVDFFGVNASKKIEKDDDITCTTEFSKVLPVEGGEIVVSIVNNRPHSKNFSNSDVLQAWTRATNVRLRLLRTKTLYGHLMAVARQDPSISRRYFYSIRDISIGGRCVCNGHARDCEPDSSKNNKLVCDCEHHTCGDQCERCCKPFVQKKWRQSRENDEFQCELCQCYGHTEECEYDEEVDRNRTSIDIHGNYSGGGVCINCSHNTEGINCERCKEGYYRLPGTPLYDPNGCIKCDCDNKFSTGRCNKTTGQCECKPQYDGVRCDRCAVGYHSWPDCIPCDCDPIGSLDNKCFGDCNCKHGFNRPRCNECKEGYFGYPNCTECKCDISGSVNSICRTETGACECRVGYTGLNCDECADGYYGEFCQPCLCSGNTKKDTCDKITGACLCESNFFGEQCDSCAPGHFNYPYCEPCNCDPSGSNGIDCGLSNLKQCLCKEGRSGPECRQCKPGFYQFPDCIPCNCNEYGSNGLSCNSITGKCNCKAQFIGEKCDECAPNLYNFPSCEECTCNPDGVSENFQGCSTNNSVLNCPCKPHVIGRQCDRCKPRYYGLGSDYENGCLSCECSPMGTLNQLDICDTTTGQCFCKEFATSKSCNQCKSGTYNLNKNDIFGCDICKCNLGASIDNDCNSQSGQCKCRPNIIGRTCDTVPNGYYVPSLHNLKFELEDSVLSNGRQIRYGFNETHFPKYSGKGYVEFTKLQSEIYYELKVENLGSFQMILKYICKSKNFCEIIFQIDDLKKNIQLRPTQDSHFENIVDLLELEKDRTYKLLFSSKSEDLLIDYFVLIPNEYIEPAILHENIEMPCEDFESKKTCIEYVYITVDKYESMKFASVYESSKIDLDLVKSIAFTYEKPLYVVPLRPRSSLKIDLDSSYYETVVLLIEYYNPEEKAVDLNIDVNGLSGNAILYSCNITTLCRQVITTKLNEPLVVEGYRFTITIYSQSNEIEPLLYNIIAIPEKKFDLNFMKLRPKSIFSNGESQKITYQEIPIVDLIELDSEIEINVPQDIDSSTKLVYLNKFSPEIIVSIEDNRKNDLVMILHYYQPHVPSIEITVTIDDSLKRIIKADYCALSSGCRVNIGQIDLVSSKKIKFQLNNNQDEIWLDYVLIVTSSNAENALTHAPIDKIDEFLRSCASNFYYIESNKSQFCDDSVFILSTKYNNGAKPCNCNYEGSYDDIKCELYGGQCKCRENVIGRQCDRCKTGYYGFPNCIKCDCPSGNCDERTGKCICPPNVEEGDCQQCIQGTYGFHPHFGCDECECNSTGTIGKSEDCNSYTGQCNCKENIEGLNCDRCKLGHHTYPYCYSCNCNKYGALDEICSSETAQCLCKENVEGSDCGECMNGFFNLDSTNPKGCTKCFCFGLTDRCESSYFYFRIIKDLNDTKWSLSENSIDVYPLENSEGLASDVVGLAQKPIYWLASSEYTGRKIYSYGGFIRFSLAFFTSSFSKNLSLDDNLLIISGGSNMNLAYKPNIELANEKILTHQVRLIESNFFHLTTGQSVSRENLMVVLDSIREIKILAFVGPNVERIELYNFELDHAVPPFDENADLNRPALSVEQCYGSFNRRGLSFEDCAPDYYKIKNGNYFECVPCDCNGRGVCDQETGECECYDNTDGNNCEKCKLGFYEFFNDNGLECHPCPCPGGDKNFATGCMVDSNSQNVYSCNCLQGYTGPFCDQCAPGYFGNLLEKNGSCQPCNCNGNIDTHEYNSCDPITGECLKCKFNTTGSKCEKCLDWHYGDPITEKNCQPCKCDKCGSKSCNVATGECECKVDVTGEHCTNCPQNMWGFNKCEGCFECDCDSVGSITSQCDIYTGKCKCKPGVGGERCNQCLPGYFNFSPFGCTKCKCDEFGTHKDSTTGITCDPKTGSCKCIEGVKGEYCDQCDDRYVLVEHKGCQKCDSCVHTLLDDIDELNIQTDQIENLDSSLAHKARHKIDKLEKEFERLKTLATDDLITNHPLINIKKSIKEMENLPDLTEINKELQEKLENFNQVQSEVNEFDENIKNLMLNVRDLDEVIKELQKNLQNQSLQVATSDISIYEAKVNEILNKEIKEKFASLKESLNDFTRVNKTVQELIRTYNKNKLDLENINNKTANIESSLAEFKSYIDRAKNTEKFVEKDITFQAYVDNFNKIKNETQALQLKSSLTIVSINELIEKSKDALATSQNSLKDLEDIMKKLDELSNEHSGNLIKLEKTCSAAENKVQNLINISNDWQDKFSSLSQAQQVYEASLVYNKLAKSIQDSYDKSKVLMNAFEQAQIELDNYLNEVNELNKRSEEISNELERQNSLRVQSERDYEELRQDYENYNNKVKLIENEIGSISSFIERTNENDKELKKFESQLDNHEIELIKQENEANDLIAKIKSLDSLNLNNDGSLASSLKDSIEELTQLDNDIQSQINNLEFSNQDYSFELDKINDMINDLKLIIDNTRDIANEINVAINFNDSSMIQLKNSPEFDSSLVTTGSLYLKTTEANAPIAYLCNGTNFNSYLSLYLSNGIPHFQFKLSDYSPATIIKTSEPINDGNWYKIEFERVGKYSKLSVSGENKQEENKIESMADSVIFNVDAYNGKFLLGNPGNQMPFSYAKGTFRGALDDVILNGQQFGLWNYEQAINIKGEFKRKFDTQILGEQRTLHFKNQDSFMCMKLARKYRFGRKPLEAIIQFKTSSKNAFLWLTSTEDSLTRYVVIYLKNGRLNVDVKFTDLKVYSLINDLARSSRGPILNDNQFHRIIVEVALLNSGSSLKISASKIITGENEDKILLNEETYELESRVSLIPLDIQCLGGLPNKYTQLSSLKREIPGLSGCINLLVVPVFSITPVDLKDELYKESSIYNGIDFKCPEEIDQCSFEQSREPVYVSFDTLISVEDKAAFGLSFVPLDSSGTLFFIRQKELFQGEAINYIYAYLDNGYVNVIVKNTINEITLASKRQLTKYELHHIYVTKDKNEFELSVDNDDIIQRSLPEKIRISTDSELFIGGVPLKDRQGIDKKFTSFEGCITNVIFNDKSLKFQNIKTRSDDGLQFSKCRKYNIDWTKNQLEIKNAKIVRYSNLVKSNKASETNCALSKNYDSSVTRSVGTRFGLTRNSRIELTNVAKDFIRNPFLTFKFRTVANDGLLFLAKNKISQLAIFLKHGHLYFKQDSTQFKSLKAYNDGRFYTITLNRDSMNSLILRISNKLNETEIESFQNRKFFFQTDFLEPFYVGGIPYSIKHDIQTGVNTNQLAGCLSDLQVTFNTPNIHKFDLMSCSNNHESGLFFTGHNKNSHGLLQTNILFDENFEIELEIRPRTKDGVVLLLTDQNNKEYLSLELVKGQLEYTYSIGVVNKSVKYEPLSQSTELCNGNWVHIKLKNDKGKIALQIKGRSLKPEFNNEINFHNNKFTNLYLGGLPDANLYKKFTKTNEPFIGCVRELIIHKLDAKKNHKALLDLQVSREILNYCPLK